MRNNVCWRIHLVLTCIMATRRTSPCKPTAMAPIAMAVGPAINFNTIPNMVRLGPHAIIFSCKAMNIPAWIDQVLNGKPKTKDKERKDKEKKSK